MTTAAPLPELLQAKLQPLLELCESYGVEKLELFGSAARDEFDPAHSDLDFIVQMQGRREPGYAARFCDFADALEVPHGRPVDLLTELMINYPYLKAAIAQEQTVLVQTAHYRCHPPRGQRVSRGGAAQNKPCACFALCRWRRVLSRMATAQGLGKPAAHKPRQARMAKE
jgi:predicted nucleotidyltransferase